MDPTTKELDQPNPEVAVGDMVVLSPLGVRYYTEPGDPRRAMLNQPGQVVRVYDASITVTLQSGDSGSFFPSCIQRAIPPKFASIEEADAWLERRS